MKMRNHVMALLSTLVLATGITLANRWEVHQLKAQIQETKAELARTTTQLEDANRKLAFLEASKARVQVTAYALTDDFGPAPVFSNNTPARTAYAVPRHTLPTEKVLNVALSPTAERKLHAKLNDTIVLMSKNHKREHLARFVDRTAQDETRPVVDVLFADAHQARLWGRQTYYAVNISQADSPFRLQ